MVNFLGEAEKDCRETMDAFRDAEYEEAAEVIETGIAKRDPFDPAPIIKTLAAYNGEIDNMVDSAMSLVVSDDATCQKATEMTTQAKGLASTIKKAKDAEKRPYLTVCQALDSFVKQVIDRLDNLQTGINKKIQPYLTKKEAERKEAARKAQEEADRIQRELDEKARIEREKAAEEARKTAEAAGMSKAEAEQQAQSAAAMVEDAPVVVAQATEDVSVKTETGSAKLQESWSFSIINFKEIPNDIYDARKDEITKAMTPIINAKIKAGIRNIPGVKIFKQAKVQTRTSRGAF